MRSFLTKHPILSGLALAVLLAVVGSSFIVTERLEALTNVTQVHIASQRALLSTIAETTARNGADSVTEQIVTDCSVDERTRFDTLLGQLDTGLARSQLLELNQLFSLCGDFYAERKAMMVTRLAREFEILEVYTSQLSALTGADEAEAQQLSSWRSLVEGEETQSVLFSRLVQLQQEIIGALLDGKAANSEAITNILTDVRETREALLLAKTKTAELRAAVTAL